VSDAELEPTDPDVQRVVPKVRRGDMTQMSFAFEVVKESWETLDDGAELRRLEEVRLWDVSVVAFAAYEETDAALRHQAFDVLAAKAGISTAKRARLVAGLVHGEVPTDLVPVLRNAALALSALAAGAPVSRVTPVAQPKPPERPKTVPLAVRKRRLHVLSNGLPA
jgi:hypothetical protein